MDLTEYAVTSLVEYLYTGYIDITSDIQLMLEVAIAAHCFQMQVRSTIIQ